MSTDLRKSRMAWIVVSIQQLTAHVEPHMLQWPGGGLIVICLCLYKIMRALAHPPS
jgi:hypothetical protein